MNRRGAATGAMTRRAFLYGVGGVGAVAAAGLLGGGLCAMRGAAAQGRVAIVGGGVGGATAARLLKELAPALRVTLIEADRDYYSCFMSNAVIGGLRPMESIRHAYAGLRRRGVEIVHDRAIAVEEGVVRGAEGRRYPFDRCILSPGVDFRWGAIAGYDAEVARRIPHAWQAGPAQTGLLRRQIEAMPDGGTVIIAPPADPFRCPPGPYERASLIAWHLKRRKPRSKILILDPKETFSKFELFMEGWRRHYGYGGDRSLIEWVRGSDGGRVEEVEARTMTVQAEVERFKGAVINLIPPQRAGAIAFAAGVADARSGWCPVDPLSFESRLRPGIHVIGDSASASPLPKSGHVAYSAAAVCAAAVVALLNGDPAPAPSYMNTCYSFITPDDAVSVAMVYRLGGAGEIEPVAGAGGVTPSGDRYDAEMRRRATGYASSWYNNLSAAIFG